MKGYYSTDHLHARIMTLSQELEQSGLTQQERARKHVAIHRYIKVLNAPTHRQRIVGLKPGNVSPTDEARIKDLEEIDNLLKLTEVL